MCLNLLLLRLELAVKEDHADLADVPSRALVPGARRELDAMLAENQTLDVVTKELAGLRAFLDADRNDPRGWRDARDGLAMQDTERATKLVEWATELVRAQTEARAKCADAVHELDGTRYRIVAVRDAQGGAVWTWAEGGRVYAAGWYGGEDLRVSLGRLSRVDRRNIALILSKPQFQGVLTENYRGDVRP